MTTGEPIRLFIVEDHAATLDSLRVLLGGEPGIEVVGVATNGGDARAALREASPELLLCDLGLPDTSGVELIRWVTTALPEVEIMAYTVFDDRATVLDAVRAGASGYVLKSASPRELIEALFELQQGGAPMTPKIARALIRELREQPSGHDGLLTAREHDVLAAVERGYSYKEIGERLNVSPHTVHSHIKKIYEKLQAESREEMLRTARRKGLV